MRYPLRIGARGSRDALAAGVPLAAGTATAAGWVLAGGVVSNGRTPAMSSAPARIRPRPATTGSDRVPMR